MAAINPKIDEVRVGEVVKPLAKTVITIETVTPEHDEEARSDV